MSNLDPDRERAARVSSRSKSLGTAFTETLAVMISEEWIRGLGGAEAVILATPLHEGHRYLYRGRGG